MKKCGYRSVLVLLASSLLFACASGKADITVKARMDGKPVAQASVMIDNVEVGVTDAEGTLTKTLEKKYDTQVAVVVTAKAVPGYRIQPWKGSFMMKPPASGSSTPFTLNADIEAVRYITVMVTGKGAPLADSAVRIDGKDAGKTDANGSFVYEYKDQPKGGMDITVAKAGFVPWRKTVMADPGQKVEIALVRRVTLTVTAVTEEYGQTSGIAGIAVSVDEKEVGKTNEQGIFVHTIDGEPGKRKAPIALAATGYYPATWTGTVVLDGEVAVKRYFYPPTLKPIRTGIFRFAGNTPNADLTEAVGQAETSLASHLFKNTCFLEVPSKTLQADMKRAKLNIDKITAKGWSETALMKTVDLVIVGSVAQDEKGLLLEAKFYTSAGKLILSQIAHAKSAGDINSTMKDMVNAVMDKFPFEGTMIAVDGDRYRINLGKSVYRIAKGTDFIVMSPRLDEKGKLSGFREAGRLRVKKVGDNGSWTEVMEVKKGEAISVGDRIVRRIYHEGEDGEARNTFLLTAKGGVPPDVAPLGGVNIYLNNEWLGSTGPDGKAEVPVPINKSMSLMLYRQGYQKFTDKVTIEQNKEAREFTLLVNNTVFRIDSDPRSADVYLDGEKIGKTPMLDGKAVPLGFHTLKISAGDDYRDWEEVVEFAKKEENRTDERKIVLAKDYLKIGERAEQRNEVDTAIAAYQRAEKGHPDYSEAHHRLAQLYLDAKGDYDGAIREFENVLSLPENQQLIYKQYAVAFRNLGHAYYEKGNSLVLKNKDLAAQSFAKAIQNLQTAKQNTRFFPNNRYDEAVHDTYYYTALSYHKLYLLTKKSSMLQNANLAWREYFDFFPSSLEGNRTYDQAREGAQKYADQLKNL